MRCVSPPPPDPRPGEWGRLHLQPQPGEHHRQVPRPRGPHPQGRWGGAGRISGGSFDAEHQPPFPPISLPPGAEAWRALLHPGCGGRGVGSDHKADPALPGADDEEEEGESREQGHRETAPSQCRDTPVPFPPPTTCPTPPQDVDAAAIKVQVCLYAFDLLYLNGEVSVRPWRGDIKSPGGGGGDVVPPGGVSPCSPWCGSPCLRGASSCGSPSRRWRASSSSPPPPTPAAPRRSRSSSTRPSRVSEATGGSGVGVASPLSPPPPSPGDDGCGCPQPPARASW